MVQLSDVVNILVDIRKSLEQNRGFCEANPMLSANIDQRLTVCINALNDIPVPIGNIELVNVELPGDGGYRHFGDTPFPIRTSAIKGEGGLIHVPGSVLYRLGGNYPDGDGNYLEIDALYTFLSSEYTFIVNETVGMRNEVEKHK